MSPTAPGLLLVDDDELIGATLALGLSDHYRIRRAATREEALAAFEADDAPPFALALVDLGLPPTPHDPDEGFALISELTRRDPDLRVLVLSGQNDVGNVHHALTLGASDFLAKPVDPALLDARLAQQLAVREALVAAQGPAPGLIGEGPAMLALNALIDRFANADWPVLITGESGVGKELVASALHARGRRAAGPFRALNCAALPAELLEAQLFGVEKGAFTGAMAQREGFFEAAAGGTLFLDEIAELPLALQAKLLRVLEAGEFYRLGETVPRRVDARVVTATNVNLPDAVAGGLFRDDLFHRLNVLTVPVPPLRERREDIPALLEHFAAMTGGRLEFTEEALLLLGAVDFPGNVRELRNLFVRLGTKHPGARVDGALLTEELGLTEARVPTLGEDLGEASGQAKLLAERLSAGDFSLDRELLELERRYIDTALKLADGRLAAAARLLGVHRSTLYSRIERLRRLGHVPKAADRNPPGSA